MKRWCSFCVLLALSFFLYTTSYAEDVKGFRVGEKYVYTLTWLHMTVGSFTAYVRSEEVFNGRTVYVVEVTGGTNRAASMIYKVHDHFVSYIDKEKKIPLKFEAKRREGFYKKNSLTIFDHEQGKAYFENFHDGSKKIYLIPPDTQDIISVFYVLRNTDISVGKQHCFNVDFSETVFTIHYSALKKKTFSLPSGICKETFYVKPVAMIGNKIMKAGTASSYISADGLCIPVEIVLKAPLFTKIKTVLVHWE
jgi:hypothetical protein